MKPKYKTIGIKQGQKRYFFGYQMNEQFKEVTKEKYEKSKLPLLKYK